MNEDISKNRRPYIIFFIIFTLLSITPILNIVIGIIEIKKSESNPVQEALATEQQQRLSAKNRAVYDLRSFNQNIIDLDVKFSDGEEYINTYYSIIEQGFVTLSDEKGEYVLRLDKDNILTRKITSTESPEKDAW